jgi:hypothetical protein
MLQIYIYSEILLLVCDNICLTKRESFQLQKKLLCLLQWSFCCREQLFLTYIVEIRTYTYTYISKRILILLNIYRDLWHDIFELIVVSN